MAVEPIEILYTFETDDGQSYVFPIHLDPSTLQLEVNPPAEWPDWTQLSHQKCPSCPLHPDSSPYCPAAQALVELVEAFGKMVSFGAVKVSVATNGRVVSAQTTIQRGLSSILGLRLATSGCPQLDFLRPLARFHQPFATREETIFRATSAYLLRQYFHRQVGRPAELELDGLRRAYEQLQWVNIGMARRLRGIVKGDANMNAIVLLDMLAKDLPIAIEEHLMELAHLFNIEPLPA